MIYEAINQSLLLHIPKHVARLLDVGCGTGTLASLIKHRTGCEAVGITYSESEAKLAAQTLDTVIVSDLNQMSTELLGVFDCVICSHVLEHLYRPDQVLLKLKASLHKNGTLLVALPNVMYWHQRLQFCRGEFKYTDGGLMDRTHYRFFDRTTARELVMASGYSIAEEHAYGGFPLSRLLPWARRWLDRVATAVLPGVFAYQFVLVCHQQ
jgi:2-polyprenyl-3-methyl-5-hydroxy-6-metoxy-1,4-benzoquinol methylase